MTEAEWLTCSDPGLMLTHFRLPVGTQNEKHVGPYRIVGDPLIEESRTHTASERKLRLFAAACIRRLWPPTLRGESDLVEALEELALANGVRSPFRNFSSYAQLQKRVIEDNSARLGFCSVCYKLAGQEALAAAFELMEIVRRNRLTFTKSMADLLRDLFGPLPFRPVACDPGWLKWNQGTIRFLAQEAYETLSFGFLPLLADALEDAGCTDAEILGHLRGPFIHVRGCWVIDLLLGRE